MFRYRNAGASYRFARIFTYIGSTTNFSFGTYGSVVHLVLGLRFC